MAAHQASRDNKQIDTPPRAVRRGLEQTAQTPPASTAHLQRTLASPHTARPSDVQLLQRTYGNRATRHLLSGSTGSSHPIIQPRLRVGAANDPHEQEADRVADQVVGGGGTYAPAGSSPDVPRVQLLSRPESSFEVDSSFESQLSSSRGGGQSLPSPLRSDLEAKFQADFSGVRVHTDAQSAQLNETIASRAFTTGQDIFFGQGEYQPGTTAGQKVIAHELTHVGQQNPGILGGGGSTAPSTTLQPLRLNPADSKYYSSAAPNYASEYVAKDKEDAFLTATSSSGMGGGHTSIYLEYFEGENPLIYQIDLTVDGAGSSAEASGVSSAPKGSSMESTGTGKGDGKITIKQEELTPDIAVGKLGHKGAGQKKTWKRKRDDAKAARKKADDFATNQAKYKYYLLGKGPQKKALNCARFGQAVLKEAGVPIHIGFWKLPNLITKASADDESIAAIHTSKSIDLHDTAFPASCKTARAFVSAATGGAGDDSGYMASIGQKLEQYHRFVDPFMKIIPLEEAIHTVTAFLTSRIRSDALASATTYATDARVAFLRGTFYTGFTAEATALKDEAAALTTELEKDAKANAKQLALTRMVPTRVTALEQSLAAIHTYANANDLVSAKFQIWLAGNANARRKGLNLDQVLAQGGNNVLNAILDAH